MSDTIARIAGISKESIVDGPGLRMTVFFQGCLHRCPGCHNPQTQSITGGHCLAVDDILREFNANPMLKGITLSGGEPLNQPRPASEIAKAVVAMGKDVVVYTGWTWEEIISMSEASLYVEELIKNTTLLIDGKYVEKLRSLELRFRGSSNQRIIDVQRSRANDNQIIEWEL